MTTSSDNTSFYIAIAESSEAPAAYKGLKFFANVSSDGNKGCRLTGRMFHNTRSDTIKSHRPMVFLVRGMTRLLLSADRSCLLPATDKTVTRT